MENHPIKAIMDLSHLVRRATEQQMADLEISSVQSRVLGYLWWKAWKKEPAFQKELEAEFKIRRSIKVKRVSQRSNYDQSLTNSPAKTTRKDCLR